MEDSCIINTVGGGDLKELGTIGMDREQMYNNGVTGTSSSVL